MRRNVREQLQDEHQCSTLPQPLSRILREAIVDELGDEFSKNGLLPNGEPNEYGLELEKLTDTCGLAWD